MSLPELILHIGVAKTGSTSLQQFLARNRGALLDQGILYPQSPGLDDHPMLAMAFEPDLAKAVVHEQGLLRGLSVPERVDVFFREFEAEIAAHAGRARTVLIVAETLSIRVRTPDQLTRLAAYLRPRFSRIRVLVYLRRQDQFATSMYSQNLRLGQIRPPCLPPPGTAGEPPPYDELLARWEAAFGRADMSPRLYEPEALRNNNVIDDFAEFAGVDISRLQDGTDVRSNVSLSRAGQALLLEAGKIMQPEWGDGWGTSSPAWRAITQHVDMVCTGKGWQPTQAEARAYLERYAAMNARIRETYFPGRATLFTEDFAKLPETATDVPPGELARAAVRTVISLARTVARLRGGPAARPGKPAGSAGKQA